MLIMPWEEGGLEDSRLVQDRAAPVFNSREAALQSPQSIHPSIHPFPFPFPFCIGIKAYSTLMHRLCAS